MNAANLAGVAALLLVVNANAVDLEYGVGIGGGTSDNILRVPDDEQDETIGTANLSLRLLESGRRLDADVIADLTYSDYQDGTYENDVSGIANADLRFKIVPDRLAWIVEESFGQASLDPFEPQTPETLENINYFTTGPDVTARLGSAGDLRLLGRYSFTTYEESNFDDERLLAGVSFGRELAGGGTLSINATTERVEFDDPEFGSNYDRHSAFLRYELESSRTRIGAQAGYTETHDAGETDGSPLLEVDVARDVSDLSTVTLLAGVRSSDAAAALRDGNIEGAGIGSSPHPVSSSGLFETRHATLAWLISGGRTEVTLSGGYAEDIYVEESGLDRTRRILHASVSRQLTPRTSLELRAQQYRNDYEAIDQVDDETEIDLEFDWNVSGRIFVELLGEWIQRDSTNTLTEFEEMRVFLRLAWRDRIGNPGAFAVSMP